MKCAWERFARVLVAALTSLVAAGLPSFVSAQDLELPEVVLVGESVEGNPVDLQTSQDAGAVTLSDALGSSNPESSLQTGARGQASLTVRGFDERQISLEWDGVEWNLPYDGGVDLARVGIGLLDQVTLVDGAEPGGAGSSSLGGSVVLESGAVPEFWEGRVRVGGMWPWGGRVVVVGGGTWGKEGQGGKKGESATATETTTNDDYERRVRETCTRNGAGAGEVKSWGIRGGVDMEGRVGMPVPGGGPASLVRVDEGTRANSDSWNLGGTARLERRWGRGQESWLTWTGVRGAYGMPPDLRTLNPRFWRWSDWSVDMGVLGHSSRWSEGFRTKVWLFGLFPRNTLKAYDDAGYDSQEGPSTFTSTFVETRIGVRGLLAWDWSLPWHLLPQRAEAKWSVRRDAHSDRSSQPEDSVDLSEYRLEAGVGLKSGDWCGWSWGTAMHGFVVLPDDVLDETPKASPALTPGVWAMWQDGTMRAKVAASRRVRFPTLKERFSGMVEYLVANPDLGPERAWNAQLDVNWQVASWATLSADLFGSLVDGLIADEAVGGGSLKLGNIDQATLAGATVAVHVTPVSVLTLWAKAAGLYARGSREPSFLPYRPAYRGQVGAMLSPVSDLRLGTRLRIEGPQHYQDRYTTKWGELGAYALLDLWASFRVGDWQLWANAQNVTNAWHEPHWGYPGPGIWVTAGAQWEW